MMKSNVMLTRGISVQQKLLGDCLISTCRTDTLQLNTYDAICRKYTSMIMEMSKKLSVQKGAGKQCCYMVCSQHARKYRYREFPHAFIWDRRILEWMPRRRGFAIGRLLYAHPASGERYYLRILLDVVRGARSFKHLRSVDGVTQPTFKLACLAMGLLGDDNEWGILPDNECSATV